MYNAEKRLQDERAEALDEDQLQQGVKKKRRAGTPPEVLASEDEARYKREEKRAKTQRDEEDPDWEAS